MYFAQILKVSYFQISKMEKIMAILYYVRQEKKELKLQVLGIGIDFSGVSDSV